MSARFPKRLLAAVPNGLALLACFGIVLGSLGLTKPIPNSGGAYPCQGHGCGCASAEACWLGCCCLTPKQRLAWAEENGVDPPAEFLAVLEIVGQNEDEERGDEETGGWGKESCDNLEIASCCRQEVTSCCQAGTATCQEGTATCCSRRSATGEPSDTTDRDGPRFHPGRCHGLGQWWIAGGQPLALPLRPVSLARATGETTLPAFELLYQAEPDTPPARPG